MKFRYFAFLMLWGVLSTPVFANLSEGLIAYYPFNGNADDASGNGHNGTVHGAKLIEDRFGNPNSNAYFFDGNDSHIETTISIDLNQGMTYSVWVVVQGNNYDNLISINGQNISVKRYNGTSIIFSLDSQDKWHSTSMIRNNQWQHFVLTIDKNDGAKIFVDSTLVDTYDLSNVSFRKLNFVPLYLGGENGTDNNLKGKMDEVRLYNRVLSDTEIQELYNSVPDGYVPFPTGNCEQAILDAAKKAGRQECIDDLSACGVHAAFAPSTGILNIPFVDVPDGFGGLTSYAVDMIVIPEANPLSFTLSGATPVK